MLASIHSINVSQFQGLAQQVSAIRSVYRMKYSELIHLLLNATKALSVILFYLINID